jgi:FlaA1/EpsC-like NDP-sugar epimerase
MTNTESSFKKKIAEGKISFVNLVLKKEGIGKYFEGLKRHLGQVLPSQAILPSAVLVFDTLMAFLSLFIALYLRIGDEFLEFTPEFILKNMVVFALVSCSISFWMQAHRAIWRYVSLEDMIPLALSTVFSTVIFFPLMLLMAQQEALPRSVPIINALVLIMLLGLPRFIYRTIHDQHLLQKRRASFETSVPVLLVGNGDSTELFIREVLHSPDLPYHPLGLITLEEEEVGRHIHGVPILGTIKDFDKIISTLNKEKQSPKQIIITEADILKAKKQQVSKMAAAHGLTLMHMLQHFSLDVVEEDEINESQAELRLG